MLPQPAHRPEPHSEPSETLQSGAAPETALFRYHVAAAEDPSVLARVLELFVLRDLIPHEVSCRRVVREAPELHMELEVAGLEPGHAEHLAQRMRNMMPVLSVLLQTRPA